jgi:hypothetical protein
MVENDWTYVWFVLYDSVRKMHFQSKKKPHLKGLNDIGAGEGIE